MKTDFDRFLAAYITAALWSSNDESTPDGGVPLDENYTAEDLDPATLEDMKKDCQAFLEANAADIVDEILEPVQLPWRKNEPLPPPALFRRVERAGHDFWLNRNGHGAGFWDGDWAEPAATRLDAASKKFGEVHLYVENGKIFSE